jgi:hypothetical protein
LSSITARRRISPQLSPAKSIFLGNATALHANCLH